VRDQTFPPPGTLPADTATDRSPSVIRRLLQGPIVDTTAQKRVRELVLEAFQQYEEEQEANIS
jgi:hypothetical protein